MSTAKFLFIFLFCFISNIFLINPIKSSNIKSEDNNKITRVVALTSLSADLVNYISNESLLGIPGSSLLKNNNDFLNKTVISSGRMPPDLEKIISLKPDLVIGAKGFHDRTLSKLNSLGINILSTSISSLEDLDILYKQIALKLNTRTNALEDILGNCYSNNNNNNNNKNKNLVVLVSSKPILSPNQDSWAGNLISFFKLNNLAAELTTKTEFRGYVNLSPEWLIKSQPENILIIKTPGSDLSQYSSMSIWNKLKAVKNNKIYTFDYYGLINAGGIESINKACLKLSSI